MLRLRKTRLGYSENDGSPSACLRGSGKVHSGFTLVEVMIGVTIFGIISIAVYSTFQSGLKSYEAGREQMIVTQTARTVFDLLSRDLRGLYYLTPNTYNRNLVAQRQMRALQQLQALQSLAPTDRESDEEKEEKRPKGLPIDLTIISEDHEQGDWLTFVTYQPYWGTIPAQPWALARVKYVVQDGNLFRVEGPITVEQVPSYQDKIPFLNPFAPAGAANVSGAGGVSPSQPLDVEHYLPDAPRELVARGIKSFDLRFGYWNPEGWYESPNWVAHERQYRNPPYEFDPRDPNAQLMMLRNFNRATDDIPAYVVVTLALAYGKGETRTQVFRTRMRLPASAETHEPYIDPNPGMVPPANVSAPAMNMGPGPLAPGSVAPGRRSR